MRPMLLFRLSTDSYMNLQAVSFDKDPNVTTPKPKWTWRWKDGDPSTFRLWKGDGYTGQPDEVGGDTVAGISLGWHPFWNDLFWTDLRPYTCETPASGYLLTFA